MIIKFKEEDKGKILSTLYNNSKCQGLSFLSFENNEMTEEEANLILKKQTHFDYLKGRVMKINLETTEFNTWLYDRDNGIDRASEILLENNIYFEIK